MRVNYDDEPDRVCTGCGKKLDKDEGVGSFNDLPGAIFCASCYRDVKRQREAKGKGK